MDAALFVPIQLATEAAKPSKELPRLEGLRVTDVLEAVVSEARMMGEKYVEEATQKMWREVFGGRVDVKLRDLLKGRYG